MSELFIRNAFDIYPLVFPIAEETTFTVTTQGQKKPFEGEYTVTVHRAMAGAPAEEFTAWNTTEYTCVVENGAIRFPFRANVEGEYFVRIYQDGVQITQLHTYALGEDLAGRYPLRGDFHLHTTRSDGQEPPHIVCANYRKKGYDFLVITDHDRYYPSLEAIAFYKDVNIPLNILPGEEVHLPGTKVHIVNAGGLFSVNGLLPMKENYLDTNGEISKRCFDDSVNPPTVYEMNV